MTAVAQPSGTVTLVFTDIEGSTKLLDELGMDAYRDALADHRRIVREACSHYSGYEVDYEGDAFFYAFASAQGAISAVSEAMAGLEEGPISIRVGIHTGEPGLDPPKYVGLDVHFAARVMSSAHGGQVVVSSSTAELVDRNLVELGEHRLKDIAEAVPLYQLGEGSFPPLKTISNTNLPRPASSFLGREGELQEVVSRTRGGARLVTLTGPGGTGKTRLALEAASSRVGEYKAGVFWVGLASLRDPTLVTETISQVLGAKDDLASHIADRELLLLLDNLEQVIDAAADLSALLDACSNLTLLVTSRELLRISGEVEYAVPPLAEPEAVSLFCERARLEPSEQIAELCARLDSLPLAVELAAARTKALTPAQILERLAGRLDLLKGGRDADPRQQTLRATIEWSYDLLTPAEQELFARLSVFAGGCTLEAAEEVCDADLDTLQSLVEKSLIRFTDSRFWMLETIREYARERLEERGEGETLHRRHAGFFVCLTARAEPSLLGSAGQADWLRVLDPERFDVADAVRWAESADPPVALAIAGGVWRYWWYRAHLLEGYQLVTAALAASTSSDTKPRLKALEAASYLAYRRGDSDAMSAWCDDGLELARESGDQVAEGVFVNQSALRATANGDQDEAEALLEESVRLLDGDPYARYPLANVGLAALRRGEARRAAAIFDDVLAMDRESGDVHHLSGAAAWLALALSLDGKDDEAIPHARESLEAVVDLSADEVGAMALLVAARLGAVRRPGDAATALGGADGILERADAQRREMVPGLYDYVRAELAERLAADDFAQAYERGRPLPLGEAVEYALASID